jgi:hypothetical protein
MKKENTHPLIDMPGCGKGKALTLICPPCCEMFAPPMDDTTVKFTEFWRWQVNQVNASLEFVNKSLDSHVGNETPNSWLNAGF